jgi:hypothetical protein
VPSHTDTVLQLKDIDLHINIIILILFVAKCPYILKKKYTVPLCEGEKLHTICMEENIQHGFFIAFSNVYLHYVGACIVKLVFKRVFILRCL